MILATMMLAAWVILARFPDTPTGRALHRWLVEKPAVGLARLHRGHLILLFLLIVMTAGLVWLVGEEATRLIGMAAPEAVGWAASFEVASIVDVAATAMVAAGALRIGRVASHLRALVTRRRGGRLRRARPLARSPEEERRTAPIRRAGRPPARHAIRGRTAIRSRAAAGRR